MRHKPLFRLILKLLGIYLIISALTSLLSSAFWWLDVLLPAGGRVSYWMIGQLVGSALKVGLGCYLFFGGRWIVDKAIPCNRPYCHECGYDLTGAASPQCPECGTPYRLEDVCPRGSGDSDEPPA